MKSVDKFIPTRTDFRAIDDGHLIITIPLPQPTDGTEITFERLEKAFNEWKEKKPPEEEKPVPSGHPSNDDVARAQGKCGIISQILSYPLSDRTAMENFDFIRSLQQQIAAII